MLLLLLRRRRRRRRSRARARLLDTHSIKPTHFACSTKQALLHRQRVAENRRVPHSEVGQPPFTSPVGVRMGGAFSKAGRPSSCASASASATTCASASSALCCVALLCVVLLRLVD